MSDAANSPDRPARSPFADNPGWRGRLAWAALLFSLAVVAHLAISATGGRMRLWDPLFAFSKLTLDYGSKALMGAAGFGALALLIGLTKAPRVKPVILSAFAILIAGSGLGRLHAFRTVALGLPPIHDVQTDWADPLMPSQALLDARAADGAKNDIEAAPVIPPGADARWPGFGNKPVAQAQEQAELDPTRTYGEDEPQPPYPPIAPVITPVAIEIVYAAALSEVEAQGWTLIQESAPDEGGHGLIEATALTGWFGFADDVIIRVTPQPGGGSRLDMRSVSRVGLSDIGANALRVARFTDAVQRRVAVDNP
jgi:fatty-acyl-CoA synthase